MVRLSAVVCVQNQDAALAACLRKLDFCDEIIVVADRCTDRSPEIARRHGAHVVSGIFPLESQRKSAGVEAASGDWILELEPDEVVDAALAWEIRAVLQMRAEGDWYELPIDNYIGETRVREGWAGGLSANRGARLYRRGVKAWRPRRVESEAVLAGSSGGELKGAIRRNLGQDVGDLLDRLGRMTALKAEDLADAGAVRSTVAALGAGSWTSVRAFVGQRGWREGRHGVLVALLSGLYDVVSHMRASDVLLARAASAAEAGTPAQVRTIQAGG